MKEGNTTHYYNHRVLILLALEILIKKVGERSDPRKFRKIAFLTTNNDQIAT